MVQELLDQDVLGMVDTPIDEQSRQHLRRKVVGDRVAEMNLPPFKQPGDDERGECFSDARDVIGIIHADRIVFWPRCSGREFPVDF
jgi:hypothetical protein